MPDKVVIIIPSQGDANNAFEDVAVKLKKEVYSNATIIKTTVTDSSGAASVAFTTLNGHAFAWDRTHNVSRVLTISHGGAGDGPNLALGDDSVPLDEHQPWGSKNASDLSDAAQAFWKSVGRSLRADGKIILLGCNEGSGAYAGNVAKAAGKHVFAATDEIAAGNSTSALKIVRSIEARHAKKPMKDFKP
jgi:hypothetical protein